MKKYKVSLKTLWCILFCFIGLTSLAQEKVSIHLSKTIKKEVNNGVGAVNLCWLLDSDKYYPNATQSMASALDELGAGSFRFPYGHLADNYLWHTPPYDDVENGLRPKVATTSQAPGSWEWAVNNDNSFKGAMDFDEYMILCQKMAIKPLVVINVFSYKYKGGPSLETLVETAAEWVKYAKKKNYKVEYWQIGNEVDHHPDVLSKKEYIDNYFKFVKAMKAVDPSIKVGPGILSKAIYFKEIMEQNSDLIDFTSCHQYMWKYKESCANYDLWKEVDNSFIANVEKMQNSVMNSVKPQMEIVITETGVSPSGKGMGSRNNVFKALWYFEVLMNEVKQPNVAYAYFWGTHSPWAGNKDNEEDDVAVLFRMDDNSRKPIADVVKLVNDNLLDQIVETTSSSIYVKSYTSIAQDGKKANLFLSNRSQENITVKVNIHDLPQEIKGMSATVISANDPYATKWNSSSAETIEIRNSEIDVVLPPLSITVLQSENKLENTVN